jgi:hypothetical protein
MRPCNSTLKKTLLADHLRHRHGDRTAPAPRTPRCCAATVL